MPVWENEEADSKVYQEIEKHSDGMISFTYHPPSTGDLDALKSTTTYRNLVREHPVTVVHNAEKSVGKV